jgi:hypothetical protein
MLCLEDEAPCAWWRCRHGQGVSGGGKELVAERAVGEAEFAVGAAAEDFEPFGDFGSFPAPVVPAEYDGVLEEVSAHI